MTTKKVWQHKDLITIDILSIDDVKILFAQARCFREAFSANPNSRPLVDGRIVANLFFEPSTRTRIGFELAAKRLGMDTVLLSRDSSSIAKGESLRDTAETLQALGVHMIVLRHPCPGSALYLSRLLDISVINAGDGAHAHPTQALLDCLTLADAFDDIFLGKKVTILGDILFSRVARSNIRMLIKLGATVTVVGPATLIPKELQLMGVTVCYDLRTALVGADALILLRVQHERQISAYLPSLIEYKNFFGMSPKKLQWLKPNALILHPGPINQGVEIDIETANSSRSAILDQVKNGIAVRMASLHLCSLVCKKNS